MPRRASSIVQLVHTPSSVMPSQSLSKPSHETSTASKPGPSQAQLPLTHAGGCAAQTPWQIGIGSLEQSPASGTAPSSTDASSTAASSTRPSGLAVSATNVSATNVSGAAVSATAASGT